MALIKVANGVADQLESSKSVNRSFDELVIRRAVEEWGRPRWPESRLVHELVVGRGHCRADMAFIEVDHLAAIEIKSGHDSTDRLMMQAAHFSLAGPEVWLVVDSRHIEDAHMVRFLMPWLGLVEAKVQFPVEYDQRRDIGKWICELNVLYTAQYHEPLPKVRLGICWRDELYAEAQNYNLQPGSRATHRWLVEAMAKRLTKKEQITAVCRQLRARDAFWRADPAIRAGSSEGETVQLRSIISEKLAEAS